MLRVGIVGAGSMGNTHALGWSQVPVELSITALDIDRERAQAIADRYGATFYPDYDQLVAHVDVVDVCTPTHLHHHQVMQAAAAGKHIICEKPLALTVSDAQEMVHACQAAGVQLLVAHVVRFFPEYALAKAAVDRGDIGQVAVVRLTRCSYQPNRPKDSWFFDTERSGGMVLDLMIHDFDYARWVAGEVESVYARSVRSRQPDAPLDYCLAILKHRSGAISNIEGGWAYPPPMFRTALEIAGDGGLIEHPADSTIPLGIYLKQTGDGEVSDVALPMSPLLEDPYVIEVKHFYRVLTGVEATPRVTAQDGLAAVAIARAVIESARTGRAITLGEVR